MSSDGPRAPTARRARVVVAEDNDDERRLLEVALEHAGYDVTAVGDGHELLQLLETVPRSWFALVVVDQGLPHMLGLEVLARTASRARFIMVTGRVSTQVKTRALELGAEAFVVKPVDYPGFLVLVDRIIAGAASPR